MMRNSGAAPRYRYALEKLSFTGEPIDSETADFVRETFGRQVCSMYGTTEIGVILVSYPGAGDFVVKPGSLGKPIPGGRVEVHDAAGRPCAPGVAGELKVWRRGEWIATKDLGRIDEDGYFYHAATIAWPITWPPNTRCQVVFGLLPRNRFTSSCSRSRMASRSNRLLDICFLTSFRGDASASNDGLRWRP